MTQPLEVLEGTTVGRRFLARSFLVSLTGDLSSKVAVLLTTLIAARALSPVEFGQFAGLSASAIFAASVWDAGVSTLLTREAAAGRVPARSTLRRVAGLRLQTLLFWFAAFGGGAGILSRGTSLPWPAILGFGASSLMFGTHALALAALRGRLHFGTATAALACGRWLTAVIALTALPSVGMTQGLAVFALAILAGEGLTLLLAASAAALGAVPSAPGLQPPQSGSLTLRAALPFAANSMLATAYNRFDVVIVAALTTPQQLGLYAPASRIQDALYLIPSAVGTVGLPTLSRVVHSQADPRAVRRLVRYMLVGGLGLTLPVALAGLVLAPVFVGVVLGSDYTGSVTPVRVLVWSMPLAAIGAPLLALLVSADKAVDSTKAFTAAFVVAVTLHLSLDWWWGATGAAIASLSRDAANVAATLYFVRRAGTLNGGRVTIRPAERVSATESIP